MLPDVDVGRQFGVLRHLHVTGFPGVGYFQT
jgi:hypothetical protein